MADVLVVDDEPSVADAFTKFLRFEGHQARVAGSGEDALAALETAVPDLVIMDVRMPGMDGLQVLSEMRRRHPDLYIIIMTAFGTSQTSIDAMRGGAFDYLTKPLDLDQLRVVINKAFASKRVHQTQEDPTAHAEAATLVGQSPLMLDVYKRIGRLASHNLPVMVVGERGTGKDLVVAALHENSLHRGQPLTVFDCPMLQTEDSVDAALAVSGGTVHLRDIDALPQAAQVRLGRALGDAGPHRSAASTVRFVASTAVGVAELGRSGVLHPDLWDVFAAVTIELPPLRERTEDVGLLARAFARRFSEQLGRPAVGIDEAAVAALSSYHWPGNVAELEHVIKRACVEVAGDVITESDVEQGLRRLRPQAVEGVVGLDHAVRVALRDRLSQPGRPKSIFYDVVVQVESALTAEALQITRGNQVKASELLGLNRATLRKKAGLAD